MQITRTACKSEELYELFDSLQADLENMLQRMQNHVTVHGGFAQGTTTTKFKTSAATQFILAGKHYTKAATDDIATPATGNTSAIQFRKDLISIDAAGTVTVTKGTEADSQAAAVKPAAPANTLELGWIEVPNSFTVGTTAVTAGMLKAVDYVADWTLGTSVE